MRVLPIVACVILAVVAQQACHAAKNEPFDAGVTDSGTDAGLSACDQTAPSCPLGQNCMLAQNPSGKAFCFPGACDLFQQDCDGGLTCGYDSAGSRACLTPGPKFEGDTCVGGECQSGLICVADANAQNPVCRRLCNDDLDCGGTNLCLGFAGLVGSNEAFTFCVPPPPPCDSLGQDCAGPNESCYFNSQRTFCLPTGTVPLGADCTSGRCTRGATCALTTSGRLCVSLCRFPTGFPECDAGTTCQQLSSSGTPLLDGGIGACL